MKTYTIDDQTYQALNGISLHIQRKQIFALLGRNGAGKTTLVDILTGVTEKTSGHYEILFKNNAPSFGICYQQEVLYELMTVDQHLYFYACIKNLLEVERSIQEQVDEAIGLLGLEIERQKTIKELSGGNRRKVSIAIAILGWP